MMDPSQKKKNSDYEDAGRKIKNTCPGDLQVLGSLGNVENSELWIMIRDDWARPVVMIHLDPT